jgi:hypothetical protein
MSETLALAGRLQLLGDDELTALSTLRLSDARGIKDFFDLADRFLEPASIEAALATLSRPTLAALAAHGIDYRGFLFAGLMLTPDGPKMLEYNIRFGDPEAQVVLPRLTSDLAEHLRQAAAGSITDQPTFSDDAIVCVVMAAEGYPQAPRTGDRIVVRYVGNPNGSVDDIAGICNAGRNVVGLMPHPERACNELLGSVDGRVMLSSLLASAGARLSAAG